MRCAAVLPIILVLALPAGPLSAQADLVVSEITDFRNYPHEPSLGVDAFAVGTLACNVGTQPLDWHAIDPRHPVCTQNAYRLADGRFEQLGQSWARHTFIAVPQPRCGAGCNGMPGVTLDVGCADVVSAALNGSQPSIGPKSEVNAAFGVFPVPFGDGNGQVTGVYKRLQVPLAELATPGARYFVEAQYVTADDAQAGNGADNTCWREITFTPSGGGFDVGFPDNVNHPREPAIFAWKAHDPEVSLASVDVPLDGRLWGGFKGADLGNGRYRWEFAIQNVTSHRSARMFAVPIAPGSLVANIRFKDVPYHSGEPYDSTDWAVSLTPGQLAWSTDLYRNDPDANALRWGTLYNFSFETDQAPPASPLATTLELFRPGFAGGSTQLTFAPVPRLTAAAGDGQVANALEAFGAPLAVQVTTPTGTPIAGVDVTFAITSGVGALGTPGPVATDAAGMAQTTVTAGGTGGPLTIEATIDGGIVTFHLFVRRLAVTWLPAAGVLSASLTTEVANLPLIFAFDGPQPVIPTPFGDICTSILSPSPDLILLSGITGVGIFDPTVRTDATGAWSRFFTGLGVLDGTGLVTAMQMYGAISGPSGTIPFISGCHIQVF